MFVKVSEIIKPILPAGEPRFHPQGGRGDGQLKKLTGKKPSPWLVCCIGIKKGGLCPISAKIRVAIYHLLLYNAVGIHQHINQEAEDGKASSVESRGRLRLST